MGRLTNAAQERFDKAQRQHRAPEWLPRVSVILSALLGLVVLFGGVLRSCGQDPLDSLAGLPGNNGGVVVPTAPSTPVTVTPTTSEPTGDTTAPVDTTTTPDTTGTEVTFPPTTQLEPTEPLEVTVPIPAVDGSTVNVPTGAYDAAVAGATNLLGPAARIDNIQVRTADPERITFVLTVDADGLGPGGSTVVVIDVDRVADQWQALI